MKFVNLTPHALRIRRNKTNTATEVDPTDRVLQPAAMPARISSKTVNMGDIDGVPLVKTELGEIENLPEPQEGVIYIASMLVVQKAASMGRTDVLGPNTSPNEDLRYPKGHPQQGLTFAVYSLQRY